MDIYLDHDRFDTDATTLGGLIAAARDRLSDSGRMIVEVRFDGDTVPSNELETRHDQDIKADEVQLITAEPFELARQSLLDVRDALAGVRENQQRAAELLQSDKPAEALDAIREALQVWQQAQETVLQAGRLIGLGLDHTEVNGQRVPSIIESLAGRLKTVREQLLANDWIGLADTLGYELDETIDTWVAMIDELASQIKAKKWKRS
jgi:hypothetical protein